MPEKDEGGLTAGGRIGPGICSKGHGVVQDDAVEAGAADCFADDFGRTAAAAGWSAAFCCWKTGC